MPRELLIRFWTDHERDELKKLFDQGWPVRKIAWRLKRSNSAIRREMLLLRLFVRDRQAASQAQDELAADLVVQASRASVG
jgi:IS30 family transposase